MNKMKILLIILILTAGLGVLYFFRPQSQNGNVAETPVVNKESLEQKKDDQNDQLDKQNKFSEPIGEFKQRVTKKNFGMYITPATSPVQPERFSGYHTGVDVEYEDVQGDVPVYALADGEIILAGAASGYGGVIMIRFENENKKIVALYGHIRPKTLPKTSTKVKRGQQIGLLGLGFSSETDGERKHLHFAILATDRVDLKGYVSKKEQLSGWLDPLVLYK